MKKVLSTTLLLCISISMLVGCGSKSDSSSTPAANIPYEQGSLTDTGFESKYLDLRFTVPEGFIMATEEDMDGVMNSGANILGADEKAIEAAKQTTVYEMMAYAPSGTPNLMIIVEKLPLSSMTEEQYMDSVKSQLSGVAELNYEFNDEMTSIEIAGQSYKKLDLTASANNMSIIQSYILRKNGDRMISFVATSTPDSQEDLNTLLNAFKKY